MEFALSDEQVELQAAVRRLLDKHGSEQEVRRVMDEPEGFDENLWSRLTQELGVAGIAVPEEYGGAGGSLVDLGVVLAELGRSLYVGPFVPTVLLAATVIEKAGTESAREELLPTIAAGELTATLAIAEQGSESWDPASVQARAVLQDGQWKVTGMKTLVPEAADAETILVVARTADDRLGVFAVDMSAGVEAVVRPSLDLTRRQSDLHLVDTPARAISDPEADALPLLTEAMSVIAAGLAAEQLGGAQRCQEMAVEYGKIRQQFGAPIGSFQALKHQYAEMLIDCESAWSLVYYALWLGGVADPEFEVSARSAALFATDVYKSTSARNIQLHGGIGFTWEHPAHLYFKRAHSASVMLIDLPYQRARLNAASGPAALQD